MKHSATLIGFLLLLLLQNPADGANAVPAPSCEREPARADVLAVPLGDSLFAMKIKRGVLHVDGSFGADTIAIRHAVDKRLNAPYIFGFTASDSRTLLVLLREGECHQGCAGALVAVATQQRTTAKLWSGILPNDVWEIQVFRDTREVVLPGTSYWWVLRRGQLERERVFGYCGAPGRTWALSNRVGGTNPCQLTLLAANGSFSGFAPPPCLRIASAGAVDPDTAAVVARHDSTDEETLYLIGDDGEELGEEALPRVEPGWWGVKQMGNFALLSSGRRLRRIDRKGLGPEVVWPGEAEPRALEAYFSDYAWFLDRGEVCRCIVPSRPPEARASSRASQ